MFITWALKKPIQCVNWVLFCTIDLATLSTAPGLMAVLFTTQINALNALNINTSYVQLIFNVNL